MNKIVIDYQKEGFKLKIISESKKMIFYIKERNIDDSKFNELSYLDKNDTVIIDNLLIIRDNTYRPWTDTSTDYYHVKSCELVKIDTTSYFII